MRAIRGPLGTNEERVYAHSAGFDRTGTPTQKRPSRTFVAALLLRTLEPLQAQEGGGADDARAHRRRTHDRHLANMSRYESAELDWDENVGGTRNPMNLISFPKDGVVSTATANSWPWKASGAHTPSRCVVPSVYVEALFRLVPVPDPIKIITEMFMTKCLDATAG